MIVTYKPIHGQPTVYLIDFGGLKFDEGESRDLPEDQAREILRNPNFVDESGENPNAFPIQAAPSAPLTNFGGVVYAPAELIEAPVDASDPANLPLDAEPEPPENEGHV
jgi:hypothetical protein